MVTSLLVLIGCGLLLVADAVPGYLGPGVCCWVIGLPFFVAVARLPGWFDGGTLLPGEWRRHARWWHVAKGVVVAATLGISAAEVPKRLGLW
jgi:hypothetical protein